MHYKYNASKINVTPKGVYLPVSKLHSILAVANLLARNNKSQVCYCDNLLEISLQRAVVNCSFSDNLTSLGVTSILLAMVHNPKSNVYIKIKFKNHVLCTGKKMTHSIYHQNHHTLLHRTG